MALGADGGLPTEFRLFVHGWNDSERGRFLFDDVAAKSVMAAYAKWGVDLAIDLEHGMIFVPDGAPDPTARDARGWCKLELRSDGSLWAVDVKWTTDGAERLTQKRQRYISPAFNIDPDTCRVTKVVNVALVAMPATHNAPALMAASAIGAGMDPKQVGAALDALVAGDAEKCMELLKGIIATAAGAADPDASTEDAPPPAGDGGADEMTEGAPPPAATPGDAADQKSEAVAASALIRLTAKPTFVAALAEVQTWRASHLELEGERQKLAAERATLEAAERRAGCAKLVTQAGRAPATVWADDTATAPKKYLAAMSIADFRDYVADAVKCAAPKGAPKAPKAPAPEGGQSVTTSLGVVTLSASEVAECKRVGAKLEVFAENKAIRDAQRARSGK